MKAEAAHFLLLDSCAASLRPVKVDKQDPVEISEALHEEIETWTRIEWYFGPKTRDRRRLSADPDAMTTKVELPLRRCKVRLVGPGPRTKNPDVFGKWAPDGPQTSRETGGTLSTRGNPAVPTRRPINLLNISKFVK